MKLNEIQDLIKFVSKSGVSEVELETKEIKIVIRTPKTANQVVVQSAPAIATPVAQVVAPVANPVVAAPVAETKTPTPPANNGNDESKYVTIKSPMIGTFYR
ncbi:MAG: acetyl-CoA carboxylase, biotin carboxyl carrier protein, partial [Sphingobacteriaceae bacterium]